MDIGIEALKIIGGGVIASFLTLWVDRKKQNDRRKEERLLATMVVASQLRKWVHQCGEIITEARNAQSSHGNIGGYAPGLPEFLFEGELEQVARLQPKRSEAVLELVYERTKCNSAIMFEREVSGPAGDTDDPGADHLCASAAQMSERAAKIYSELAAELGWFPSPFNSWETKLFAKEAKTKEPPLD